MAAIQDLRNSGSGAWQMIFGKAPEPEQSDPFKPEGEWVHLEDRLWTVDPDEFTWWAGHAHPTVRRIVAAHTTCPPELLDRLAEDPWVEIRQAALGNTALDPSTLARVASRVVRTGDSQCGRSLIGPGTGRSLGPCLGS